MILQNIIVFQVETHCSDNFFDSPKPHPKIIQLSRIEGCWLSIYKMCSTIMFRNILSPIASHSIWLLLKQLRVYHLKVALDDLIIPDSGNWDPNDFLYYYQESS